MIHSIGMTSRKLATIVTRHADPDIGGRDGAAIDEPGHDGVSTLVSVRRAGDGTPDSAARPG